MSGNGAPDGALAVRHESDILAARVEARRIASAVGFSDSDLILIATAVSEIARNMLDYAQGGEVSVHVLSDGGRRGIEIVARDQGPGIADVELAMQDGYSTGKSLGLGLPGARRLMDELQVDTRLGDGTTVRMRKWVP